MPTSPGHPYRRQQPIILSVASLTIAIGCYLIFVASSATAITFYCLFHKFSTCTFGTQSTIQSVNDLGDNHHNGGNDKEGENYDPDSHRDDLDKEYNHKDSDLKGSEGESRDQLAGGEEGCDHEVSGQDDSGYIEGCDKDCSPSDNGLENNKQEKADDKDKEELKELALVADESEIVLKDEANPYDQEAAKSVENEESKVIDTKEQITSIETSNSDNMDQDSVIATSGEDTDGKFDVKHIVEINDFDNPGKAPCVNEHDDLKPFQVVIAAINFKALSRVAIKARLMRLLQQGKLKYGWGKQKSKLTCTIDPAPLSGSYNLVYQLKFSDGVKWAARIPGHGASMGDLEVEKMNYEYQAMRYIRSNTSIPIPEVYLWDTNTTTIGAAFALMSFVEGEQLCNKWFDESWSTEEKRLKVLGSIAEFMSQLYKLQLDGIGAPRFDDCGALSHVDYAINFVGDDDVAWASPYVSGPFEDLKEFLYNDWDEDEEVILRGDSTMRILHYAIESMPDFMVNFGSYPLSPRDLNHQNILVDEDGNITGFIDWDEITTKPACLGCARYPSWITRDWDPAMYGWDCGSEWEDLMVEEDSPEALSRYRQHYSQVFERLTSQLPNYDPRHTRLSHIIEAIDIGAADRLCRQEITEKLLEHAFHGKVPFTLFEYANAYVDETTEEYDEQMEKAFKDLWRAEWEPVA